MRRSLAALAAASVAVLALAPGAPGDASYSSRVSIHVKGASKVDPATFYGRVSSEKAACESDRKVVLFGQASGAPAERIDKTHSKGDGHWRIRHAEGYPNYYAEVKRSTISSGACRADISKSLHVG